MVLPKARSRSRRRLVGGRCGVVCAFGLAFSGLAIAYAYVASQWFHDGERGGGAFSTNKGADGAERAHTRAHADDDAAQWAHRVAALAPSDCELLMCYHPGMRTQTTVEALCKAYAVAGGACAWDAAQKECNSHAHLDADNAAAQACVEARRRRFSTGTTSGVAPPRNAPSGGAADAAVGGTTTRAASTTNTNSPSVATDVGFVSVPSAPRSPAWRYSAS